MRKRLRIALFAGPIAALAFMAFSASAVAGNGPVSEAEDPQTANTPYLAWAGNQVRLAKCLGEEEMESDLRLAPSQIDSLLTPGLLLRAKFRLEDWSGTEPNATGAGYRSTASIEPQFLNDQDGDTVAYLQDGRLCFSVTVSSLKPGLAVIKGAARIDLAGFTPGFDILGKHQFVVIWMRSQAPAIREVANADFPDLDLGDPSGNGIFNPFPTGTPFRNGLVEITVGGNFPLGNDFAGIDADNVVNLPADWAWLASKFAVDDYDATGGRPGSASHALGHPRRPDAGRQPRGRQQLHPAGRNRRRGRRVLHPLPERSRRSRRPVGRRGGTVLALLRLLLVLDDRAVRPDPRP